jgi:hypothetical protein
VQHTWGSVETVFVSWVGAALAVLIPAALFLQGAFPVFTVVWLAIPLLAVTRSKDAARVGNYLRGRVVLPGLAAAIAPTQDEQKLDGRDPGCIVHPSPASGKLLADTRAGCNLCSCLQLAVGEIGGWSAARTQSIWPSLVSAVIWNALMVAWAL